MYLYISYVLKYVSIYVYMHIYMYFLKKSLSIYMYVWLLNLSQNQHLMRKLDFPGSAWLLIYII